MTYDPNQPGAGDPAAQPTQPYAAPYGQPGFPPPGGQPGYAPFPGQQFDAYGRPLSDKSKIVAGLLGILLGFFGAGRFYMGDTKTGVLQLVVSVITCGLGSLWGLIDGIMILVNGGVDAQGRVLRD